MILLDELRITMSDYRKDLKELYEVLGIEKAKKRFDEFNPSVITEMFCCIAFVCNDTPYKLIDGG